MNSRAARTLFKPKACYNMTRLLHNSVLHLVRTCNNLVLTPNPENQSFRVETRTKDGNLSMPEDLIPFLIADNETKSSPTLLTHLRPCVVEAFKRHLVLHRSENSASPWSLHTSGSIPRHTAFHASPHVAFLAPSSVWTSHFQDLFSTWGRDGRFEDILSHWSNEPCPVFLPQHEGEAGATSERNVAFAVERAALPLFSLPNYGCLLIAYVKPDSGPLKLWVPRRSWNKKTFPGRLDVTAGGGIPLNQSATSAIIRECAEEASLDESIIRERLSWNGAIQYRNRSPEGWLLPGIYHLFTLRLPPDISPKLNHADGEVDSFSLMDVDKVMQELLAGSFKPSSALAYVRFLIQEGIINEDTDPSFTKIRNELRSIVSPISL